MGCGSRHFRGVDHNRQTPSSDADRQEQGQGQGRGESWRQILKQRLAGGDISMDEYRAMLQVLQGQPTSNRKEWETDEFGPVKL